MKSTSGEHYLALDHVRALAAFMVFTWHFIHGLEQHPVPFGFVPAFVPAMLLEEGHTGVALFMTLSGYLFAKLLDGKAIRFSAFIWNRAVRLLPLLMLVIAIVGLQHFLAGESLRTYLRSVLMGVLWPTLPNGGWSITIEVHYYLILPLFLWLFRRSRWLPLSLVFAALLIRTVVYFHRGEVQSLAYWTIVGRVDQFVLGMLAFHLRQGIAARPVYAAACLVSFCVYFWYFGYRGGFWDNPGFRPSQSPLWIVHGTFEATAYAIAIAWYDVFFARQKPGRISRFFALIGAYSYSIYLLHFFFVYHANQWLREHVAATMNFYTACLWSVLCFLLMVPIGHLSFRFIEGPFLRLRKRYTLPAPSA